MPSSPTQPTSHSPTRRRVIRWLAAWAALSLLGGVIHWATWINAGDGSTLSAMFGESGAVNVGNFAVLPSTPGWLITIRLLGKPHGDLFIVGLLANAIAWAIWLSMAFAALWMRRLWVRWPRRQRSVHADSTTAPADSRKEVTASISRRRLLANSALGIAGIAAGGAYARATLVDPWSLRIARYTVTIRDLPPGFDGARFVQISDTHLGPRVPSAFIAEAVRQAVALAPDAFLLTGDYVHRSTSFIDPAAALFAPLTATGRPVIGVMGNHDWYASGEQMRSAMMRIGVRMIDNARVFLTTDRRVHDALRADVAGAICIAGLGDLQEDACRVEDALAGVPESMPRMLLSHNPDSAELPVFRSKQTAPPRVDLMLSGHTHGGQVRLPLIGTPIVPSAYRDKYAHGLCRGPACPVLVSAGVGMSIVPVRFNVPPEIVEVTLVRGG